MDTLAYSKDPDGLPQIMAFHHVGSALAVC